MPGFTANTSKLLELGEAMSNYAQMLDGTTREIKKILVNTDSELIRTLQVVENYMNGWNLDCQESEFSTRKNAFAYTLNDLKQAAKQYEVVKEELLYLIGATSSESDCERARVSLGKLAEALESYYGVQLLETITTEEADAHKVLVKRYK